MDDELYSLRNLARPLGFWVGVHAHFDVTRGGGQYYVMPKNKYPGQRNPSLLRFATREMVEEFLSNSADHYAG